MINAKDEFIEHVQGREVLCAIVAVATTVYLKIGYTQSDYEEFLSQLDFRYDNGYGTQQLYGKIWYKDGTWSSRDEYDGSEWWEHHVMPAIPEELK
jgi:hypothetical protein